MRLPDMFSCRSGKSDIIGIKDEFVHSHSQFYRTVVTPCRKQTQVTILIEKNDYIKTLI